MQCATPLNPLSDVRSTRICPESEGAAASAPLNPLSDVRSTRICPESEGAAASAPLLPSQINLGKSGDVGLQTEAQGGGAASPRLRASRSECEGIVTARYSQETLLVPVGT